MTVLLLSLWQPALWISIAVNSALSQEIMKIILLKKKRCCGLKSCKMPSLIKSSLKKRFGSVKVLKHEELVMKDEFGH
ncbi:Uncharacterised protein [Vibrio cholerae]|nr:Uncharacterised protein [Vibrio cholerae]